MPIFILMISMIFIIGLSLTLSSWHKIASQQNKRVTLVLQKISNVQTEMQLFSKSLNQKDQQIMLKKIQESLNQTQQSVEQLAKASDVQNIAAQIVSTQEDVDKRIDDLKNTINNTDNKQYLNANALPFSVIAVDVIGGQPYVSINKNGLILSLSIGDSLAEWRLIAADYESGFAEFMNTKLQYIKVNI